MPEELTNNFRTGMLSAQYHAPMRPEPTKERLEAPSSRVTVQNTSTNQNHIVIDRYNVGHELRPGERREMEMLNAEIASFQEHRRPGRFFPEVDPAHPEGKMKPLHAILIEGVPELVAAEEPDMRQRRKG
jgi:hypothetical protein